MGKQTLFHPVSLNIIRGAAEYGNFKLGKLRQKQMDKDGNVAFYQTSVLSLPDDCKANPNEIRGRLNDLYSRDVLFTHVWIGINGKIAARFMTGDFDVPLEPITVKQAIERGILPEGADGIPF
jgi:hypothetical protein